MKVIVGGRGSGTTTNLLFEAGICADDNVVIFTPSNPSKEAILSLCEAYNIDPPEILSPSDILRMKFDSSKEYNVFIDNVDIFICEILQQYGLFGNVKAITVSLEEEVNSKTTYDFEKKSLDWSKIEEGQVVITNDNFGVVIKKNEKEFAWKDNKEGIIHCVIRGLNYKKEGIQQVGTQKL